MSKGLGRVERQVLTTLEIFGRTHSPLRPTEVALVAFNHPPPAVPAEYTSVCRALASLERKGLVAGDRWGRWGTAAMMGQHLWWRRTGSK